jgi:hypothetical protein
MDPQSPTVGASTIIIYVIRICGLFSNVSMSASIDIVFYGPQIRMTYYDCRGATVGDRGSMPWMPAYIAVPNLLSMISMGISQKRPISQPSFPRVGLIYHTKKYGYEKR